VLFVYKELFVLLVGVEVEFCYLERSDSNCLEWIREIIELFNWSVGPFCSRHGLNPRNSFFREFNRLGIHSLQCVNEFLVWLLLAVNSNLYIVVYRFSDCVFNDEGVLLLVFHYAVVKFGGASRQRRSNGLLDAL